MKIYETGNKTGKKAYALDEVPIGCVIVAGDKIMHVATTAEIPTKSARSC